MIVVYAGNDEFVMLPAAESFNATAMLWNELQEELRDLQSLNSALSQYVKVCVVMTTIDYYQSLFIRSKVMISTMLNNT